MGRAQKNKGVPHLPTQDDVYEGYFVPGGASVFFNVWFVIPREGSMD